MKINLKGIYVPLITPVYKGKFDRESMHKLIDSVDQFIDGYVPCLSTGEGEKLSSDMWREAVRAVRSKSNKPVIAGILKQSLANIHELTNEALILGCSAVAVSSHGTSSKQILSYYKAVNKMSVLPIIAYNSQDNSLENIEDIVQLNKLDKIVGIKDSSQNPELMQKMIEMRKVNKLEMAIFQGMDNLLGNSYGCDGYMVSLANLEPQFCREMFETQSETINQKILEKFNKFHLGDNEWYLYIKKELVRRGILRSAEPVKEAKR
ncbi:MAG: dihydrodipicolinate synthase family protein [Patescibacteria group bacterium]